MTIDRFNIRVYGLLLRDGAVLVADELIKGMRITKFPGGGLEFGEGPMECLVREVREELGVQAVDVRHFYTTDFFQPSAYRAGDQIISLYYTFAVPPGEPLRTSQVPFDFAASASPNESFRWLDLSTAQEDDVTLPIDRVVLARLIATAGADARR